MPLPIVEPSRDGEPLADMRSGDPARPAGNQSVFTLVGRAEGHKIGGFFPGGDAVPFERCTGGPVKPTAKFVLSACCSARRRSPATTKD